MKGFNLFKPPRFNDLSDFSLIFLKLLRSKQKPSFDLLVTVSFQSHCQACAFNCWSLDVYFYMWKEESRSLLYV